jgi:translation initiation factor 2 beta subunit (eIF-2beta)/eIF-5
MNTMLSFNDMVNEAYMMLDKKERSSMKLVLPNIKTEVSRTRLIWINIEEIMCTINRMSDHFIHWLQNEIPDKKINWFSGDKMDGIIIHGKYKNNNMLTALVLKYINNYVVCSCKSPNTIINKMESGELKFICNDCGMSRYVE